MLVGKILAVVSLEVLLLLTQITIYVDHETECL
jgi:hypothetical protein